MAFWKKYPLPKFPPNLIPMFDSCCELLSEEDLTALGKELMQEFDRMAAEADRDKVLIDQMKKACNRLVEAYPSLSEKLKRLVVGALRYSIVEEDAISDAVFAAGLLDDVKVINHVLERVGVEGYYIRFGR